MKKTRYLAVIAVCALIAFVSGELAMLPTAAIAKTTIVVLEGSPSAKSLTFL